MEERTRLAELYAAQVARSRVQTDKRRRRRSIRRWWSMAAAAALMTLWLVWKFRLI